MNDVLLKVRDLEMRDTKKRASLTLITYIDEVLHQYEIPLTVRQVFYRLVADGKIENTISSYKTISDLCKQGRYRGYLPWNRLADETRDSTMYPYYETMAEALSGKIDSFRYDRWKDSPYYVEVMAEKRTLTGLLQPIALEYGLRYAFNSGFDSTTAVYDAIRRFVGYDEKECIVLYYGDLDPSGEYMQLDLEKRLNEFNEAGFNTPHIEIRKMVLTDVIAKEYNLARKYKVMAKRKDGSVYDKLEADPRAEWFRERHGDLFQIEIEALPPDILTDLVRQTIEEHLPENYHEIIKNEESAKKEAREYIEGE